MADLQDVENAIACIIAQAVYPDGTAAASATGAPAKIYRGWPTPGGLDADLRAGIVNISIFPLKTGKNVTRYTLDWIEVPQPPVYLTLTAAGDTVTVAGQVSCPTNAAITVGGMTYVYPLQATDTMTGIATALANLIGPPAISSGPVITIPNGAISASVGAVGNIVQETRQQVKNLLITLWCPNPKTRDAMAAVVDTMLANLNFINLQDGTKGRIIFIDSTPDDVPEKALLFRRDFNCSVEYSTTNATNAAAVVSLGINLSGGLDPGNPAIKTINV